MGDGAVALNNRWLRVRPSTNVPAYGCVEVTGTSIVNDELVVEVKRPSQDGLAPSKVMFISNTAITANEIGLGTYSFPCWASSTLAASTGSTVGTVEADFTLQPGRKGFYVEANINGLARVKAQPFFDDEDCVPDRPIVVFRYECEKNDLYIDDTSSSQATPENDTYDCCDWENPIGYLWEYHDRYVWDEDQCDWVYERSSQKVRKIMCCDHRCASNPPESDWCDPCAYTYLSTPDPLCCGEDLTLDWSCNRNSVESNGFDASDVDRPTRLEVLGRECLESDNYQCEGDFESLSPALVYEDPNGIESYSFTVPAPSPCTDTVIWEYKIQYELCEGSDKVTRSTNAGKYTWRPCEVPTCGTCPQDQEVAPPEDFFLTASVTGLKDSNGNDLPAQDKTMRWDADYQMWVAYYTNYYTQDTGFPNPIVSLEFSVAVECAEIMMSEAFRGPGGGNESPFRCYNDPSVQAGSASLSTGPGGFTYGSSDTLSGSQDAKEILDNCPQGSSISGGANLGVTITAGVCT